MISDLGMLLSWTFRVFSLEFTLYGFTFSLWQVFAFSTVACIVGRFLAEVFFGD